MSPNTEQPPRATFDQMILNEFKEVGFKILARHPEARSLAMVVDYQQSLNDANVNKGLWIGPNGSVTDPAAVFGSMHQTLELLQTQIVAARKVVLNLQQQAGHYGQELVKTREALQTLQAEQVPPRADPSAHEQAGQAETGGTPPRA